MKIDQRKIVTLVGTLLLAGLVIVGGIYGPSAWKVLRQTVSPDASQVVIQDPPIRDQQQQPQEQPPPEEDQAGSDANTVPTVGNPSQTAPESQQSQSQSPQVKKYREPDMSLLDMAPSIAKYFGPDALSDAARDLAYAAAWNIHQYVDGYLFGLTAGPQMNEEDIKKYIFFHKTLWDNRMKDEPNAAAGATFSHYMDVLFNRGIDAFDAKDKVRIEQFHQEIHDLDTHLFRNDPEAKVYGATPFATKR